MKSKTAKITFLGLATACALVLSYVESLLPPIWSAVPGVKVGLPNIVIIYLLYKVSFKSAAAVSFVRIIAVSMLFGNVMIMSYSIAGAVLSLGVMAILKKTKAFSTVGVSIAGAVAHNLGQIIVAMVVMQTKEIGYYMIVLCVTGVLAGIVIGIAGGMLLKYTEKIKL
ncbi:MAG: Gx transporter family protein [Clostridia bacterium]|nr:Gx transporter family protein [Clostridia bacterium]